MVLRPPPAARPAGLPNTLRLGPVAVWIALPVALAVGLSHVLLGHAVDRMHAVVDRAVTRLAPVAALRADLGAVLAEASESGAARAAARVERALADAEALVAARVLDPGPVTAVRREWDTARAVPAAAFRAHAARAAALAEAVEGDALGRLGAEWRAAGRGRAERLAVVGGTALFAGLMALAAGALVLRMAGELEGSETRYAALARHDPLTGIDNRQELHRRLGEELQRARRFQRPVSALLLGADHLEEINQGHGHLAGDVALVALAGMVTNQVRAIDRVARYGGGAFGVLLPETDLGGACVLGERLRRHIAAHPARLGDGTLVPLTVSVGVAAYPSHAANPDALLAAAADALHRARQGGRNRVEAAPMPVPAAPAAV